MAFCSCDECTAKRVSLIVYAASMGSAFIEVKHLIDLGDGESASLAWRIIQEAARLAEKRDLHGEIERAEMEHAAALRAENRLH